MAHRPLTSYEEKMDDIMRYVSLRVSGRDRVKVRSKEDLRQLILKLDDVRRTTTKGRRGSPKITEDFVEQLLKTRRSNAYIGADIGRGRNEVTPSAALEKTREHPSRIVDAKKDALKKKKGPRLRILRRRVKRGGSGSRSSGRSAPR